MAPQRRQWWRQLALADRVAERRAGAASGDAGPGPGMWIGGIVHLSVPGVRRAGVGDRPLVQRLRQPVENPRRRCRRRRLSGPRGCPLAPIRDGVLRCHHQPRFLPVLRYRRLLPELHRAIPEARGHAGDCRGGADAGDHGYGARSHARVVGAEPLVPALARVVAPALVKDGDRRRGGGGHNGRRVGAMDRLATCR